MKEPQNFKGTPGDWEIIEHNWSDTSIVSGEYTVCTKSIEGDCWTDEEGEEQHNEKLEIVASADFRLMCQSKNMLAAMQKFVNEYQNGEYPNNERAKDNYKSFKEIIKLALGE